MSTCISQHGEYGEHCGEDYNILAESHVGHQPERDEKSGR